MKAFFNIPFERRIFGLDVLRAFAILTVVYSHGEPFLRPYVDSKIYQYFFFDGVTIFFVLSGFLIGKILIQTAEHEGLSKQIIFNFWKRRWLRTLPNYYLMLTFLVVYFDWMHHYSYKHSIAYFFFAQNLWTAHPFFFGEAWSLAVEEWFYLLVPMGLWIIISFTNQTVRASFKSVIILWLAMTMVLKAWLIVQSPVVDKDTFDDLFRKLVVLRMDSIMIGVAGAFVYIYKKSLWNALTGKYIGFLLLFLTVHTLGYVADFNNPFQSITMRLFYTLTLSIAVAGLLPKMYQWQPSHFSFIHKSVIFIAIVSYSMYLINLTMFKSIFGPIYNNMTAGILADSFLRAFLKYAYYWIMVVFLAYLMYQLWEKRWMDLREKYTP